MVGAVSAPGVLPGKCLERALATWWLLSRRGVAATVRVGAALDLDGPSRFHAWVECDGEPVNDAPDVRDHYIPLGMHGFIQ